MFHAERSGPPDRARRAERVAEHTFTGNRALQIEEPLLFEIGRADVTGVDLPEAPEDEIAPRHSRPQDADRSPRLSEPETMRHYVRLSQKNYAIDSGIYPLGSCTMKHNPRLNEKMARLPGFADITRSSRLPPCPAPSSSSPSSAAGCWS